MSASNITPLLSAWILPRTAGQWMSCNQISSVTAFSDNYIEGEITATNSGDLF